MKDLLFFSIGLLVSALPMATLADQAAGTIEIEGAYVRAVPPGQPNSAAFMTLKNEGDADHALVAASSDVSEVVELHTHIHEEGMMRMRQIERIDVAAGGEQTLEPGGLHLMLIGLQRQLQPGDTVSLNLEFDDGSSVDVEAPVRPIEGMSDEHHHMQQQ
jgi:copper(I)-binding protein